MGDVVELAGGVVLTWLLASVFAAVLDLIPVGPIPVGGLVVLALGCALWLLGALVRDARQREQMLKLLGRR